jgi:hypothetical protein
LGLQCFSRTLYSGHQNCGRLPRLLDSVVSLHLHPEPGRAYTHCRELDEVGEQPAT